MALIYQADLREVDGHPGEYEVMDGTKRLWLNLTSVEAWAAMMDAKRLTWRWTPELDGHIYAQHGACAFAYCSGDGGAWFYGLLLVIPSA